MILDDVFVGGHPALDFINTVQNQDKERSVSAIGDWTSFIQWTRAASLFTSEQVQKLTSLPESDETEALLGAIHDFRELVFMALRGQLESKQPNDAFKQLEQRIQQAISQAELCSVDGCYMWVSKRERLEWVIDDIALVVESLLRSPDLSRLRECGRCSWMFLNSGRGKGRRWCSMNTCGNRAKSSSFRKKGYKG